MAAPEGCTREAADARAAACYRDAAEQGDAKGQESLGWACAPRVGANWQHSLRRKTPRCVRAIGYHVDQMVPVFFAILARAHLYFSQF